MRVEADRPDEGLPTISRLAPQSRRGLAIEQALVLAPEGDRFLPERRVVVDAAGRIEACHDAAGVPAHEQVLSLAGLYLIPGLIDAHCHLIWWSSAVPDDAEVAAGVLEGRDAAGRALRSGVTRVRDAGTRHSGIYALRARMERDPSEGPSLHPAGPNLAASSVPADWRALPADGPDAVRRAVAACHAEGAAWIKLIVSQMLYCSGRVVRHMTDEEIRAASEAAHGLGLKVGAHCEGDEAVRAAVANGVDCVEHGLLAGDEAIAAMAQEGVAFVPTLAAYEGVRMERAGEIALEQLADYRSRIEAPHSATVRAALDAGVLIASGSDGSYAEGFPTLFDELDALARAGLSPAQALTAATSAAARVIGSERACGSIEPGKAADLVGLKADPLASTQNLREVAFVMRAGTVVRADEGLAA